MAGANETILIMCSSSTTCSTIREYLCSDRDGADEASSPGRKLMRKRLREYFIWKSALGKMARNLKASSSSTAKSGANGPAAAVGGGGDEGEVSAALKRKEQWKRGKAPANKRRRVRGGGSVGAGGDRGPAGPVKASDSDALEAEAGEVADL